MELDIIQENHGNYHCAVLLKESVDAMNIQPDGIYVDVTMGAAGHTREILSRLTSGKLFSFDQDRDAWKNAPVDAKFTLIKENFGDAKNWLRFHGVKKINGLLADLGVSSHQFDTADRGFSFRFDGPLDMRMNHQSALTAGKVVNEYEVDALIKIFRVYGEVEKPHVAAHKIVAARPVRTTQELIVALVGNDDWKEHHQFLAKVFQSLRIEVNQEMQVLENLLTQLPDILVDGGRAVFISYHSLEDRMVKSFFRSGNIEDKQEKDFFGNLIRPLKPLNAKPILPSSEEIEFNSRARSAKMRIAEKIG
ncbi:MAG: 16S rRNA (cytosine(1402)-N(4))-methyltransferase RsmH [Bacteroidetes bacterium]|nr:16S rRNA (cytosine(1402)-N(4))-methyltransferase RsmH [Bacteroidota bacterium]